MLPADGAAGPLIDPGAAKSPARRWPRGRRSRIPNWVYTDPDIYAREQERIFAGPSWNYVALEAEIPNPGDYKRSRSATSRSSWSATADGGVSVCQPLRPSRRAILPAARGRAEELICPYHSGPTISTGSLIGGAVPPRRIAARAACRRISRSRSTACAGSRWPAATASCSPFSAATEPLEEYLGDRSSTTSTACSTGASSGCWAIRASSSRQLEADVREHQGPLSRQPPACVPGVFGLFRVDQRSGSRSTPTGRHAVLVSRRRAAGERGDLGTCARSSNFKLRDPRCSSRCASSGNPPCDADDVAQPDRAAAVEHLGDAPDRPPGPRVRARLDLFRLCRRHAGDDPAAAAPGQPDGAGRAMSRSTTAR